MPFHVNTTQTRLNGGKYLTEGTAGLLLLRLLWGNDLNWVGPWNKKIPTCILKGAWGSVFFFFSFLGGLKENEILQEPIVIPQHSRLLLTLITLISIKNTSNLFVNNFFGCFYIVLQWHYPMRWFFLNSIIIVIYGTSFRRWTECIYGSKLFGKAPAGIYRVSFTILFLTSVKELLPLPSREWASVMLAGISSLNDSKSTFS